MKDISVESAPKPSQEMVNLFTERTEDHINRVRKSLKLLMKAFPALNKKVLVGRLNTHDNIKYSSEEKEWYIWLTWFYKMQQEGKTFEYPPGIEEKVREATYHHITNERHHPQFHKSPEHMLNEDLAEMVADWAAMGEELGTSLHEWAENKGLKKNKFADKQVKLIREMVKYLEDRKKDRFIEITP
jgi:hypothetical protein